MPVSRVQALNAVQRIPEKSIIQTVTSVPNTHYTCPAGKKAKVKFRVQCTHVDTNTIVAFMTFGGVSIARWADLGTTGIFPPNTTWHNGGASQEGSWAIGEKVLNAGETIETDGTNGTIATFNLFFDILEVPV